MTILIGDFRPNASVAAEVTADVEGGKYLHKSLWFGFLFKESLLNNLHGNEKQNKALFGSFYTINISRNHDNGGS